MMKVMLSKKAHQDFDAKIANTILSGSCLFIEGKFKPEMSCGFIVKIGHGTEI